MQSAIEQLKISFGQVKNEPSNFIHFFEELFSKLVNLPKNEIEVFLKEIENWSNEISDQKTIALTCILQGARNFHSEKYDQAFNYYFKAENILNELDDQSGLAVATIALGSVYRTLGDIEPAIKNYNKGIKVLKKSGEFSFSLVIAYYNLAGIYTSSGNLEEAIHLFQEILKVDLNISYLKTMSMAGLAEIYLKQKKFEQSKEYFEKALADTETVNSPAIYSRALSDYGIWFFESGDFQNALKYQQEALKIRSERRMAGAMITNMLYIAEIYQRENRIDETLEILVKALELAESIKVLPKVFPIHQKMSELYELQGKKEQALHHFKMFHDVNNAVNQENIEKKVKTVKIILEAEQTSKENQIIKAQKLQIEKSNIELQKTIDELNISKINRKAKMITLMITISLFIIEDSILHFIVAPHTHHSFLISLMANGLVIFAIKPIETLVEHFLLHRFIKIDKEYTLAVKELELD